MSTTFTLCRTNMEKKEMKNPRYLFQDTGDPILYYWKSNQKYHD